MGVLSPKHGIHHQLQTYLISWWMVLLDSLYTMLHTSTTLQTSLNMWDLPSVRLPTEGTTHPQTWLQWTLVIMYQHFMCGFKYYVMKGSN